LISFLSSLISLGIHDDTDHAQSHIIRFINIVSLTCFCFSVPFFCLFSFEEAKYLRYLLIPFIFGFLSPLFLNRSGYYFWAKAACILTPSLAVLIYGSAAGKVGGLQFVSCGIAAMVVVISDHHYKHRLALFFSCPLFSLLALEFSNYSLVPRIQAPLFIPYMYWTSITVSFIFIFISIRFYILATTRAQSELQDKHNELGHAFQELQQTRLLLEKANQQTAFATLTRGIAHEIKNPISTLLSGLELINEHQSDPQQVDTYILAMKDTITRLNKVLTTMLHLGSPVAKARETSSVNQLIENIAILVNQECKKSKLKFNMELTMLPLIPIDPASIGQAILNIILNAIQATDAGGHISIKTRSSHFEHPQHGQLEGVCIAIRDTGIGISADKIHHLFDPFVSGKKDHSGLGLSIVLKIIHAHQGIIKVDSKVQQYTQFELYLPVEPPQLDDESDPSSEHVVLHHKTPALQATT